MPPIDDLPPEDEDFLDEDFDQGTENDLDLGDDADQPGDDEGGQHQADPDNPGEPGEPSQQVRQPTRAQARVQEALRRAQQAEADAAALRQQLRDAETNRTRAGDAERERQLLEQMDPIERAEYRAQRAEQKADQNYAALRQEMADANDRAAFAAACARNPALARIADQVESTLVAARQNGQTMPREVVASYLIGQQIITKAPGARARQGKQAATRVNQNRARPVTGGSDVTAGRPSKDDAAARRARLEGASI